jgi:hypothetical protein
MAWPVATLLTLSITAHLLLASAADGGAVNQSTPNNETRTFRIGLLTTWHIGYDFSGFTSASAVSIAIDKVHSDPQLNANGRIKLRLYVN